MEIQSNSSFRDINAIAERLVELTRQKLFLEAQTELFSESAAGIEPDRSGRQSVKGLKAMQEKEQNFLNAIASWQQVEVSNPIIATSYFSVKMRVEAILKTGHKVAVNEIIVYEVANGKIVKEQFFY